MFKMFHKTLFRSLNIFNLVKGRFLPKEEQTLYLFNLYTSFEIFSLNDHKKPITLQSKHHQHLFSKAFYICIGPNIDGIDTFFVIRDTDIIHFQYSETENIFISINHFELPNFCITPDYGYYEDGQLIISCFHGGLCGFEINKSQSQLIFNFKPCTSVLQSFPVYKDCFCRIETGLNVVIYRTKPFEIEDKRNYENNYDGIFYSFPFGQDGIIFCTKNSLKCQSTNSDTDIIFPSEFPFDPIVFHTPIAPSDVLVLTQKGAILRLQSDLKLTLIRNPENINMIIKIFNLDGNNILLVNKCHDHIIFNINSKSTMPFLFSTIGLSNISIYNPKLVSSESPMNFAPQAFSYVDNELITFRQGMHLSLIHEIELPAKPTGLFSLQIENKDRQLTDHIIISFENGSKLFEVVKEGKSSFLKKSDLQFYEEGKTIDVATFCFSNNQMKIFQITANNAAPIPFLDHKLTPNRYPEKTAFTAYTKRMNIRITEKNVLYFTSIMRKGGTGSSDEKLSYSDELDFSATCLTISPPNADELSDYIVIGAEYKEKSEFAVVFYNISSDELEREKIINEKFPFRVHSIKFIDATNEKPLGILVGLENGSLYVGELNFEKQEIVKKQILQLGISPCHIKEFKIKLNTIRFGLSSRMWLLEIQSGKNLVKPHPFSVSSPSFMTMDQSGHIFLISGKTFGIYHFMGRTPINPDYYVIRTRFPNPILSLKIVDQFKIQPPNSRFRKFSTPLLLIICQKDVYLVDSTCPSNYVPIIKYDSDIIAYANYSNRVSFCKSSITSMEFTVNSFLAIATHHFPNSQNRERHYDCINIYKVDFSYVKYLISNGMSEIRKNPNSSNTLLNPIISTLVPYRINAISVTNAIYSAYQKFMMIEPFVIIGSSNTVFVYMVTNQKLSLLAKLDNVGTRITNIYSCADNIKISIYVSDIQQSITLLYFDISNNKIFPVSEEGAMRPISTEISPFMITPNQKMVWCGGDKLGNFFIFNSHTNYSPISPQATESSNKKTDLHSNQITKPKEFNHPKSRLWLIYNINVGDVITGVDRGCDLDVITSPFPVWYSTIGGTIGCFLEASALRKNYMLMRNLEIELSKLFYSLTNCDSITYRFRYFQSYQICDLDVLDIFQKLPLQRKEYILKELEKKNSSDLGSKTINSIDEIEAEILTCASFFWLWSQDLG